MKKSTIFLFAVLLAATLSSLTEQPSHGNAPRLISCSLKPLPASFYKHHVMQDPRLRVREGTSLNWSGYATVAGSLTSPTTGAVTAVTGSWLVPSVTGSAGQYSSLWVGIDGYSSSTVEQLGTEQDVVSVRQGRKTVTEQQNYTWFEMYPSAGYEITGFPNAVGDVIQAGVIYTGTTKVGRSVESVFTLAITNVTENVYFIVPASYTTVKTANRSSAEWVVEAPSSYRGVLPLADFGTTAFADCLATINGYTGPIDSFTYDPMTMETTAGVAKATPSGLTDTTDGSGFTVTWSHQ